MRLVFFAFLQLSISLTVNSFTLGTCHISSSLFNRYPKFYQNTNQRLLSRNFISSKIPTMVSNSEKDSDTRRNKNNLVVITDLARYAVKGLSGDLLESVMIPRGGVQTFPDDRRFALLKETNRDKFKASDPEWLHKENFLCAFSAPDLMASFRSNYDIVDGSDSDGCEGIQRLLTLRRRNARGEDASTEPVLGPIDLGLESGREELAAFFSNESNQSLVCVTKETDGKVNTFQFGNTRAGVKNNPGGNTRTVHIVNRATVREFSEKTGLSISAMRFRPNIIIDGIEPWEEFNWVGQTLRVVSKGDDRETTNHSSPDIIVKVLTRTVRCEGIGIDPLDPSTGKLNIPKLLSKNYPEHGPYLGVYASLEVIGGDDKEEDGGKLLSAGDTLELL